MEDGVNWTNGTVQHTGVRQDCVTPKVFVPAAKTHNTLHLKGEPEDPQINIYIELGWISIWILRFQKLKSLIFLVFCFILQIVQLDNNFFISVAWDWNDNLTETLEQLKRNHHLITY